MDLVNPAINSDFATAAEIHNASTMTPCKESLLTQEKLTDIHDPNNQMRTLSNKQPKLKQLTSPQRTSG